MTENSELVATPVEFTDADDLTTEERIEQMDADNFECWRLALQSESETPEWTDVDCESYEDGHDQSIPL